MDLQGDAGVTQRSRAGEAVITPSFESIWPEVERRLRALLYRRGLDQPSADDIVQEVAYRVLAGRVTYTSAKDLLRWAGPVACNLHVDLLRQRARLHDGDAVGDRPATNDVAGEVADRMELQRAFRGLAKLRPADRDAIIDAVTADAVVPHNRKEAVRLAVRRHRARSRLVLVMEQIAAWVAGLGLLRRWRAGVAVAAVPVVVVLPLALRLPGGSDGTLAAPAAPITTSAEHRALPAATAPENAARVRADGTRVYAATVARPPKPPRNAWEPDVDKTAPNGARVRAGGDDRREDDRIVCVSNVPLVPVPPRVCV